MAATEKEIRENERIYPGSADAGEIEIVREVEVARGKTARFFNDVVRNRSSAGEYEESTQLRLRRSLDHDDGVVVAPIDESDQILLIRQFRHAARMWLRELPRGARDKGETVEEAASRELREEIGYEVLQLQSLGRIAPDAAQLETVPHLLAARVRRAGAPQRESTEAIDRIIPYRYSALRAACRSGDIIEGYTLAATLRLEPFFDGDRYVGPGTGSTSSTRKADRSNENASRLK